MRSSLFASLTMAEKSQLGSFINLNPTATEKAKEQFVAELRRVAGLKRFNAETMAPGLELDIRFNVRSGWQTTLENDGFTVLGKLVWARGKRNPIWAVAIRNDVIAIEFTKVNKVHVWILQGRGTDKYGKRSVEQALKLLKGLGLNTEKGQPIVREPPAPKPVKVIEAPKPIVEAAPPPAPEPEPIVEVKWSRLNDRRVIAQAFDALRLSGIDLGFVKPATADDLRKLVNRHPLANRAREVILNFVGV